MDSENKKTFFAHYSGAILKDVLKEEEEMVKCISVDADTKISLFPGNGHCDGINSKYYGKIAHIMVERHHNVTVLHIVKQSDMEMLRDFINEFLEKYNGRFLFD